MELDILNIFSTENSQVNLRRCQSPTFPNSQFVVEVGLNWLVYIIPPLVIIAGAYILYRALRAWRQAPAELPEQNQPQDEPGDEYVARIEEELRRQ